MTKKRRKVSMRHMVKTLTKDTMPKTKEDLLETLSLIHDPKFGLGVKPVTLSDVLSAAKKDEDFDFFKTYYESSSAKENIEKSNQTLDLIYFDEDEEGDEFIEKIMFRNAKTISQEFSNKFKKSDDTDEPTRSNSTTSSSKNTEEQPDKKKE
ncbi:hypothetical protein OAA09_00850 [bacterium]|nr:hypothetical protein [bacterium]